MKSSAELLAELEKISPTQKREKPRRTCMQLNDGFAWNPLLKYPRNKSCFCGSGEKSKHCCLDSINRAIKQDQADYIKEHWERILTGRVTFRRP